MGSKYRIEYFNYPYELAEHGSYQTNSKIKAIFLIIYCCIKYDGADIHKRK
jgi:hypothetical protein